MCEADVTAGGLAQRLSSSRCAMKPQQDLISDRFCTYQEYLILILTMSYNVYIYIYIYIYIYTSPVRVCSSEKLGTHERPTTYVFCLTLFSNIWCDSNDHMYI